MKCFIVVGEQSADNHAAEVVKQLQLLDNNLEVRAWGGDSLRSAGVQLLRHINAYSSMGFWEVFKQVFQFKKLIRECYLDILDFNPDVVLLLDFGGFNLRIARLVKGDGKKVIYYIPPKIWAWGAWRAKKLKKYTDYILVTLPFEPKYFDKLGIYSTYVGNPVADQIRNYLSDSKETESRNNSRERTIVVLPGSRNQEVAHVLPFIRELVLLNPDLNFFISKSSVVDSAEFAAFNDLLNVELFEGCIYKMVRDAHVAITTSGTATLEVALLGIPQIVVYKTSNITYQIAKRLAKINFISLVNLIAGKKIVTELIQTELSVVNLNNEMHLLMSDSNEQKKISEGYSEILKLLGNKSAARNVAQKIYALGRS
ncbi:MAG: lipid-A-disaccharide synthase [Cyclobacteriaceae bacterium]